MKGTGTETVRIIAFALLMVCSVVVITAPGTVAAQSAPDCSNVSYATDGSGSYEVTNVNQLQCMGNEDTSTFLSDSFVLTQDIDASDTASWNDGKGFDPVGDSSGPFTAFTGTFDGRDYMIEGLHIDRSSESEVGLFGNVGTDGEITNVGVVDADVSESDRAGGLVGYNEGTVEDSYVTGSVSGGIRVGGLVGLNQGIVRGSYSTADVSGTGRGVGGLVGYNFEGSPETPYATVEKSYATGDVSGGNRVGGLVGYSLSFGDGGDVTESYATGTVTASGDFVGGLVGVVTDASVKGSYATGKVSASGNNIGGLVGLNDGGSISSSYWDEDTTEQTTSAGGTDLTTSQMKGDAAMSNMTAFDFTNTWDVETGSAVSYPFLRDNTQSPAPGLERTYAGGDGTASNPYEISDWYELDSVRENLDANFTLVNDLNQTTTGYDDVASETANVGKGFAPIGGSSAQFTGTFDGGNNTVEGLVIDRPSENDVGLFGQTDTDGVITNVGVINTDVTGEVTVGGLVGDNSGDVTESYVTGDVSGDRFNIGGLVGENSGTVTGSYATANVSGDTDVGGLVGYNTGTVAGSYATGDVSGSDFSVGGLVGDNDGTVRESYATGNVSSSSFNVGGLVGSNFGGTVMESYATGSVTEGDRAGGLIGYNNVGTVTESYAMGDVSGGVRVGGFVGYNTGTVTESYATGGVSGSSNVGGLVGFNDGGGTVSISYWDMNTTNQISSDGGTGLTTDQLKANSSLSGFDFTSTWDVVNTSNEISYPFLRDNTQTPAPGLEGIYAGGDGTEANPYEISDWYELDDMRLNLGANFTLVNDLDKTTAGYDDVASETANGGNGFDPVGASFSEFTGTFDGGNNTIERVVIDRPSENDVGLFGEVDSGSEVSNVGVVDADVSGDTFVGSLVGLNRGTVSASYAAGNVSGSNTVGGLVGTIRTGGTVTGSYATGDVSGGDTVGGLVGGKDEGSTVSGSYAMGEVSGGMFVAGLVGYNIGNVEDSYATGKVSGDDNVGGLVGLNIGTVSSSYWDEDTTGQNTSSGGVGLTTDEMIGGDATRNMDGFNFVGNWYATESYPVLVRQGAEPFFDVNVTGTNSPVDETETLQVTADVTNLGGETGTQTVNLTDTGFGDTERDSTDVTLNSGESKSVQLDWSTSEGDAGTGDVTLASDDDTDTATVTVQELPFFEVNITDTNSPVNETETLTVDVNVTNTGGVQGTQTVTLTDKGFADQVRGSVDVTLDGGSFNDSVTLEWNTAEGDAGTGDVTVASDDDTDNAAVEVGTKASYEVTIENTNSPVIEGERLTVSGTVVNEGDENNTVQTVSLSDFDGNEVDSTTFSLNAGEQGTFNFTWDTTSDDSGTGDVTVASDDDTDTSNVEVGTKAFYEVEVTGTNAPIVEGDTLTVSGTVTNTGDENGTTQDVSLSDFDGVERDKETFSLNAGEQESFSLSLNTTVGDSATDDVTVASGNDTEGRTVEVQREASFAVNITDTNSPVGEEETLTVRATVTNTGEDPTPETQSIVLRDTFNADLERDTENVTLGPGNSTDVTLEWATQSGDGGTGPVTVASEDTTDVATVTIDGLLDRRDLGRGEEDSERESSRDLGRGESGERDDLRRDSGRNERSNRRDRGR